MSVSIFKFKKGLRTGRLYKCESGQASPCTDKSRNIIEGNWFSKKIYAKFIPYKFWRNWFYPNGVPHPCQYNYRIVDMSTVGKDNWGQDIEYLFQMEPFPDH